MQRARPAAIILLSLVAALACRDKSASSTVSKAIATGAAKNDADKWADTGRMIDHGVSSYSIISDTTCPGARVVNTRFEAPQDIIVRITESNTSRDCVEGLRSEFTAMVHTRGGAFIDSIHGYANGIGVVNLRDADGDPLLVGSEYGGGSGPMDESRYWNLRTGKPVFHGEGSIQSFVANGKVRYLTAAGGNGDTLGVIEYGDGRNATQRVVFTRGLSAGTKSGSNFQVNGDTLEGPRSDGHVVVGAGSDTVPIRGVTLRVRVSDVFGETGLGEYEFSAAIVDDKLVALPRKPSATP
ncbi:MAG TPA: hypothetical protein VGM82_21105 [Gemmatimonadaceae bacterium]|jgi:hypothetical protein